VTTAAGTVFVLTIVVRLASGSPHRVNVVIVSVAILTLLAFVVAGARWPW
jgi:hypothetical protein